MVRQLRARAGQRLGLLAALTSAAVFATAGPFGKSLLVTGWSSGAVVLLRVAGASVILLPLAIRALGGRWHLLRANAGAIVAYGAVAVAGCQVAYFYALQHLSVGVALLLEYLAIVLVVVVVCLRTRSLPSRLTGAGTLLALVGLALVLNIAGAATPDPVGVLWGLVAACGLATYFLIAARETSLPPIALAGFGMTVATAALGVLGLVGVLPMHVETAPADLAGWSVPWWVAIAELALVGCAMAYVLGIVGARALGSTVASFVGLTEVLFAIIIAWALLGELPTRLQLVGGAVVLAGVVAVKLGERRAAALPATPDVVEGSGSLPEIADFASLQPTA